MDSYKTKVIKSTQTVDSGKSVPVSSTAKRIVVGPSAKGQAPSGGAAGSGKAPADAGAQSGDTQIKDVAKAAYEKGYADGAANQKKAALQALEAVSAISRALPLVQKDIVAKGEEQIVRLAIAIAEKILHTEVTTRKDVILEVLKNAIRNVADTDGMKIRLNPQDFRYMMEVKKDFLQSFDSVRNVVFEEDAAIKRGGAVVESALGEVDARLDSQLKEIKAAMLKT
ncbi:MAG: FliH/SctL family protein [Smithellaceae bacterium]